jgi:hypothetical protein
MRIGDWKLGNHIVGADWGRMEFGEVPLSIPVFCGPIIRRDTARPSSVYFDLTILPDNDRDSSVLLDKITLDNYFTYSVTIIQPIAGTDDYCTILEGRKLMQDPAAETDAQLSHTISVAEFNEHYAPGRALRFMLLQPSSDWKLYELRNVKAFAKPLFAKNSAPAAATPSVPATAGLVENIEEQLVSDFRTILARSSKITHNKLALGSHLAVEIVTKKAKKKKKSSSAAAGS